MRALTLALQVLAINKPAGVATVDELGFGVNSLMSIVKEATYASNPQPGHRLDKPVSGVLMLGTTPKNAGRLLMKIQRKDQGVTK